MTTVRIACGECGFWMTVTYKEHPPAALTSKCGNCGGKMEPQQEAA